MRYKVLFPEILALVLLLSCSSENPVQQTHDETLGAVTGKVLRNDSTALPDIMVFIPGTNFIAVTDSTGAFAIFNVPEGTYSLSLYNIAYNSPFATVTIKPGDTVRLADYVLQGPPEYNYPPYRVRDIYLFQPGDTTPLPVYFPFDYTSSIYINTDSIMIRCQIVDNATETLASGHFAIRRNNATVYDASFEKSRIATPFIALSGNDTIALIFNDSLILAFILLDSAMIPRSACPDTHPVFAYITTGKTTLQENTAATAFYAITIDQTPYFITFETTEACDWDIYLINDSISDTCWWRNPSPIKQWGACGVNQPVFTGDIWSSGSGNGSYNPDIVTIDDLSEGTYTVLVRYADGPPDSTTATPQLNIGLRDTNITYGLVPGLTRFYVISPLTPMRKNETWIAGRIQVPEMTFLPIDTILQ